jgi:nicotinate (nicotinamide) nucleotide adenylyltransferase
VDFLSRYRGKPKRLGILPGSFNPPTRAHLALAEAALQEVDEVVLVLPGAFPHKTFDGASFAQRAAMLRALPDCCPRLSAATSEGGLFIDIAQECRAAYGLGVQMSFICGRDAAERMVNWDYGKPNAINRMLEMFQLLVAGRDGPYEPPAALRQHIRNLPLPATFDGTSASDVRRRIRAGRDWQHLVPEAIVSIVCQIYRPSA